LLNTKQVHPLDPDLFFWKLSDLHFPLKIKHSALDKTHETKSHTLDVIPTFNGQACITKEWRKEAGQTERGGGGRGEGQRGKGQGRRGKRKRERKKKKGRGGKGEGRKEEKGRLT
jgi:hypothetical protein